MSIGGRTKEEAKEQTKTRFDWFFQQHREYYEKQTKQDELVKKIIESLHIEPNMTVVDLGTGTGYLAFLIAKWHSEVKVIGVDVIEKTLEENRNKAKEDSMHNIEFRNTDGIHLPLDDASADVLVTRLALHHFVDIEKSFQEFQRILKPGGQLFICDPTPDEMDTEKFVDTFMQLVPDGHITFYTKQELDNLAAENGFELEKFYMTDIYFPSHTRTEGYRKLDEAGQIPEELKKAYCFEIIDGGVWAREKVLNVSYIRK